MRASAKPGWHVKQTGLTLRNPNCPRVQPTSNLKPTPIPFESGSGVSKGYVLIAYHADPLLPLPCSTRLLGLNSTKFSSYSHFHSLVHFPAALTPAHLAMVCCQYGPIVLNILISLICHAVHICLVRTLQRAAHISYTAAQWLQRHHLATCGGNTERRRNTGVMSLIRF